jgi:hypothetical protein
VLEVGIVLQVPTPSALPHTWTLKWVYKELGGVTGTLKWVSPRDLGARHELPLWELESQWTPESSERNCRGQNPLVKKVFYIIGKLLKLRCLKWALMTHLYIWNTSYDQTKGRESNWQFDSRPIKVRNQPDFLACRSCATYRWKALAKGYNFAWNIIEIKGLHVKVWAPKVARVLNVGISRLPFASSKTKCHLDAAPVERRIVYYKGEGGGFPQVWAVVSLVILSLPVARPSIKSAQIMH